jgi:hypothetical protein
MTRAVRFGRAGALAVAAALCLLLATSPARAQSQCVGDCDGDGMVAINELILGVNIALGLQPVSACPAFENAQGQVDIAQLIKGVNNALNGCPATPTPGEGTPTDTPTLPVIDTPTATGTPVDTPTPTPTGMVDTGFTQVCQFIPSVESPPEASKLQLFLAALGGTPLQFGLSGSAEIDCGAPQADGSRECSCNIQQIDPIGIPSIGTVCITKSQQACAPGKLACNGGDPLGITLNANGNIGACTGNTDCTAQCDTFCAAQGLGVQATSGCTGFCSAGAMGSCNLDADCLVEPNAGACNGPDPVGAHAGICQCQCVDGAAGAAARPGELQCNLASNLVVETAAPCGDGDVTINVGSTCVALTTATASTLITNANFSSVMVPTTGALSNTGQVVTCDALRNSADGMNIRGVVDFFGSALGDLVSGLFTNCGPPQQ